MSFSRANSFVTKLGLKYPIIQAPMAGVTTAQMVAETCKFGGLGSIPVSHIDLSSSNGLLELQELVDQVQSKIPDISARRNVNLNFFCQDIKQDPTQPQINNWFDLYEKVTALKLDKSQYSFTKRSVSFKEYEGTSAFDDLLSFLKNENAPKVVSFHFGHPTKRSIEELQRLGVLVLVGATSNQEIQRAVELKVDGIICQGYEAGGHRGSYLDQRFDEKLSTASLTKRARWICSAESPFIIAAGGISSPTDIGYMLSLGACALQLGTVFLATSSSRVSGRFKALLEESGGLGETTMTDLVSGKPARTILTPFIKNLILASPQKDLPDYSFRYNVFKQLKSNTDRVDFILAGQNYQSINSQLDMKQVLGSLVKDFD